MKIGIIGNGFVGKATTLFTRLPEAELVPCDPEVDTPADAASASASASASAFTPFTRNNAKQVRRLREINEIQVMTYDIRPEACFPKGATLADLDRECDILFFCLPTPLYHDGSCYTKILEESISKCKNPFKVIRSTVPVGFSLQQGCYFMPEFLTEANWANDFKTAKKWVVGIPGVGTGTDTQFKHRMHELITTSQKNGSIDNNELVFCSTNEAEMLKLTKNCFLSAKVSIMNEIYDFCQSTKTNYTKVIEMAKDDARMGTSHFSVPGPDGNRGFGGTCFPKDTHSIYYQMVKHRVNSIVFPAVLTRNDTLDRSSREWSNDVWRTTVPLQKGVKVIVVFDAGYGKRADTDTDTDTDTNTTNNNTYMSNYLTNICIEKLSQGHFIILITPNSNNPSLYNAVLRSNDRFIVKTHDITKPIFMPKVDEIYYAGYNNDNTPHHSRVINELSSITRVIELWTQHANSCLYVIKPYAHDHDHAHDQYSGRPSINYTKIFEESCTENTGRLVILF
jgi:UDPglucose 6-dehydrogenase